MPFWGDDTSLIAPSPPTASTATDKGAISVGTRMTTTVAGRVVAVLWYCPAGWDSATGTVYASVYDAFGALLAQRTLDAPVPGWNRVDLAAPVELAAGSSWTAAVWLPARPSGGDYAFQAGLFTAPVVSGDLTGTTAAFDYTIGALHPTNLTTTWFGVDVVWQSAVQEPDTGIPPGYPNESTTGPAAGTTLVDYTGPADIPAGVYLATRFPIPAAGFYQSTADDLVFGDCHFEAGLVLRGDRLSMERTRVTGGLSLSGVDTAVLRLLDVHRSGTDLLHITSDSGPCRDITITESCFRDPVPIAGAHADGVQVRGCRGLTIRHCAFDMGPWVLVENRDVLNSAVFLQNAHGGNQDVRIEDSYLNGGGFALVADVVFGHFVLTGNRWGKDWEYGPVSMTGGVPTLCTDNRVHPGGALVLPNTVGTDDMTLTWGPLRSAWRISPSEF